MSKKFEIAGAILILASTPSLAQMYGSIGKITDEGLRVVSAARPVFEKKFPNVPDYEVRVDAVDDIAVVTFCLKRKNQCIDALIVDVDRAERQVLSAYPPEKKQ